jgi:hypothetical protein
VTFEVTHVETVEKGRILGFHSGGYEEYHLLILFSRKGLCINLVVSALKN